MPAQKPRRPVNPWVALFFIALLGTGLSLFRDYAISWDEIPTREFGQMYVEHQVPDIFALEALRAAKGFAWERHGPVFEIALATVEWVAGFADVRTAYSARHVATFFVFFAAVALFYAFCRRRFGEGLSLFAAANLMLTLVFFANAFYDTKDVPFLAVHRHDVRPVRVAGNADMASDHRARGAHLDAREHAGARPAGRRLHDRAGTAAGRAISARSKKRTTSSRTSAFRMIPNRRRARCFRFGSGPRRLCRCIGLRSREARAISREPRHTVVWSDAHHAAPLRYDLTLPDSPVRNR